VKPYYDADGIVIYHGDCRDVLPTIDGAVMVADPPYGISYRSGQAGRIKQGVVGDDSTEARDDALRIWGNRPALVFGKWTVARPPGARALLVWDKGPGVGMGALDIPWKPNHEEIYVYGFGWVGHRGSGVLRFNGPGAYAQMLSDCTHPNGKPLPLMMELVSKCPPGTVVDPFMGSGTTLRAAKDLGRRAIGIEIEERYCEIAAKRLSQRVLALGDSP
jgi:site-specific DNA-methyltransferase (adenine-specific)